MTKMFDNFKQYSLFQEIMRLKKFFFVFTLRQGTILVAVHQIALGSLLLIILLTGISHVGTMLTMLHTDMKDDAETREHFTKVVYGNEPIFVHGGDPVKTINERMFNLAQHLASETAILLYSSTTLTSIYLLCCISLLYGAVKYKCKYMIPWIIAAVLGMILFIVTIFIGDGYTGVVGFFGGHNVYYICCTVFIMMFMYTILAVMSFVMQADQLRPQHLCRPDELRVNLTTKPRTRHNARGPKFELGERMVLIDHAAQSSLLSTTQLNKLSHGTLSQFV